MIHLRSYKRLRSFLLCTCSSLFGRWSDGPDLPSELNLSSDLEDFRKDLKALTIILPASPFLGSCSRFVEISTPPELDLSKDFDLSSTSCFFGKFVRLRSKDSWKESFLAFLAFFFSHPSTSLRSRFNSSSNSRSVHSLQQIFTQDSSSCDDCAFLAAVALHFLQRKSYAISSEIYESKPTLSMHSLQNVCTPCTDSRRKTI